MVSHPELRRLFCAADAVCFDVDSTVIREEGIDELAKFCGVEHAVSEMTRRAMGGAVPFKAALTERLALIQPSREQVQRLIAEHPPHLTPGIRELVSRLQERNVQVFLISGGFRSIVEHVASKLNIPSTNVFANRLKFYFNEKEKEREHKQGELQREREKQAPHRAGGPMWDSIPRPWDHDPSRRQMPNRLSHQVNMQVLMRCSQQPNLVGKEKLLNF
ncbi:phosphoserine phosphatase isoform X2 [Mirounga angustirostris]|uniref:phosphoserine phosphatase isoform X2 n=1 Tax=Mirounga angustirostris TaxID=9716 RepID=UPI0023E3AA56|nr:phosphoserine phosphatase isoform X2 [Mirounga angustirostris]